MTEQCQRKRRKRAFVSRSQVEMTRSVIAMIGATLRGLAELTPEERAGYVRINESTFGFILKAMAYATSHAHLVRGFVDTEALRQAVLTAMGASELRKHLRSLDQRLEDSEKLAGRDAFRAAMVIYGTLERCAHAGSGGRYMREYEDLRHFYPGPRTVALILGEKQEVENNEQSEN